MQWLKKLYNAFFRTDKLVLLDYKVYPSPVYSKDSPHRQLLLLTEKRKEHYRQLLLQALPLKDFFLTIQANQPAASAAPAWNNHFFPGLDMVMLYTILTVVKPRQYIEIGSGTSTRLAAKAKAEQQLSFSITCIDPHPRKEIKQAAGQWLKVPLQQAPLHLFEQLEENDILFFDGSHLVHANSDVQWFFMEVLPVLKKGVIVQVHDIYLPYDYPQNMCSRFYAEQYMLATALLSNPGKYEILAPLYYISEENELKQILQPLWNELPAVETHGGSFWFRIKM